MHKSLLIVFHVLLLTSSLTYSQPRNNSLHVMPVPAQITLQEGKLRLNPEFLIAVSGAPHERIYAGATSFLRRLDKRTGLFIKQDKVAAQNNTANATLQVTVKRPGKVVLNEEESYNLLVTPQKIELTAETDLGALHGLETVLQLVESDKDGYYLPSVTIQDKPRFAWRGLLMDVARHFMPLEVIQRNLDGMAAVKMNVLHLHLSDDQGFRIESRTFPRLHEMGSDGNYYTQQQIKELIRYADERGIRIIPEFDVPGHTTSWFVGYPEFASAPGPYAIERRFGVKNPTFNPTKEETYQFLDAFFKEVAALFPDEYIHIGGDENNGKQWKANEQIQAYMQANNIKDSHGLQSYFNTRMLKILTQYNRKMIGWDEILQPGIPNQIMIQSWRGKKSLYKAAAQGYPAILSNGYYVDLAWSTDRHYLNDPIPADAELSEAQRKLILGGEAAMWSEWATEETIDSRIWPRTAAIAERLWSPATVKDVNDMYRRLEQVSIQLEEAGLQHEKNYGMMLRRLANSSDITALQTLVDVLEPVEDYQRARGTSLTTLSPYTLVVDAARPDAGTARKFRQLVDAYLAKPSAATAAEIKYWLTLWKNNHVQFLKTAEHSPVLKDVETLSASLSALATLGLEAIECQINQKQPSASWLASSSKTMEEGKQVVAKCELRIVPAIEKLVKATTK